MEKTDGLFFMLLLFAVPIALVIYFIKVEGYIGGNNSMEKKEEKTVPNQPLGGFWYFEVLFRKYAVFSGRARRKEFWQFFLANTIIGFLLLWIDYEIGTYQYPIVGPLFLFGLHGIYTLAVIVPSAAVTVRRLHDIGKSGWWLLITIGSYCGFVCSIIFWYKYDFGMLEPLLGITALMSSVILLVFVCLDSKKGENKYGLNPKEEKKEDDIAIHSKGNLNPTINATAPTKQNLNAKLSKVVEEAIVYPEQFLKQIESQEPITLEQFREYPEKMAKILILGTLADLLGVQLHQRDNLDLNAMKEISLATDQIYGGICRGTQQQKANIDAVLDDLMKQSIQNPDGFLLLIESPEPMTSERFHQHTSKEAKDMIFGVLFLKLLSVGYAEEDLAKDSVITHKLFDTSSMIYNILRVSR